MTTWTVTLQAPLSMGIPRREHRSRLPFPSPEGLPDSGIKPVSPALAGGFLTTGSPGKSLVSTFIRKLYAKFCSAAKPAVQCSSFIKSLTSFRWDGKSLDTESLRNLDREGCCVIQIYLVLERWTVNSKHSNSEGHQ